MTFDLRRRGARKFGPGLPLLIIAMAAAGCASVAARGPSLDPARERGQSLAERRCAGCHAVGLDEAPGSSGPRFRDLALRYNALSLRARFREISAHGSGEMPPLEITAQEAEDLMAYFSTLPAR